MKSYFSANRIPQSTCAGPSPLPMATIAATPASRARATTSSRSESNRSPSRWACESTNIGRQTSDLGLRASDFRPRPSRLNFALGPRISRRSGAGSVLMSKVRGPTPAFSYFNLAPTGTSSKKLASTGLPPSSEAATIIPFDSNPRSLRGARLATITTFRPTRVSGA